MYRRLCGVGLLLCVMSVPSATTAHHALQAQYDTTKRLEFTGVLTRFAMINPHVRWFFDVKAPDGTITKWEVTAGGPGPLRAKGLTRLFADGQTYKVVYSPSRDGTNVGWAVEIHTPAGLAVTLYDEDFPDPTAKKN